MNRRSFLKLAGLGLLASLLPKIDGEVEMEFGDLLLKIANNARLTPQELDYLKRIGAETQQRNAQAVGSQNGAIDLTVNSLTANRVNVGKSVLSGFSCNFTATTSCSSGSTTEVSAWTTRYNDGFAVSSGTITIPKTGVYQIILSGSFDAGTPSGVAYAEIVMKLNGTRTFPAANGSIVPSFPLPYLTSIRENSYQAGDTIKVDMLQNSTATVNCYAGISIREIRTNL